MEQALLVKSESFETVQEKDLSITLDQDIGSNVEIRYKAQFNTI